MSSKKSISIQTIIDGPVKNVWDYYTKQEHIINWNRASEDLHTVRVKIDFRAGGKFLFRMENKDKSVGFDYSGMYNKIRNRKLIEYTLDDKRKVDITFSESKNKTRVIIDFEANDKESLEIQRSEMQSILNNFKEYVESK